MKKIIFVIVGICFVMGFMVNVNPVLAYSDNAPVPTKRTLYRTPTRTAQPTQTTIQPTQTVTSTPETRYNESLKSIFYSGVWNNCLTIMVNTHPEYSNVEIMSYCRKNLQLMIDNKAYEYRHSDMWQPIPMDIDIYK